VLGDWQARRRALAARPRLRPRRGLLAELSPLVAELSPRSHCSSLSSRRALAELSSLVAELSPLVAELSPLVAELSPSSRRSSPSSRRSNRASSRARGLVWQTHLVSDHRARYTPRPPDQRSGTSSSTTRPTLGDCAFNHPTSAWGFVDHVSRCAWGLLRPLSNHSLRPTARGLIFSATC
jgi:hypothetical protein